MAFDIVGLVEGEHSWFGISFWMIAAGVIGGLLAAVFGLTDWMAIPSGTRAKNIGLLHGATNGLVTLLFIVSWLIRNSTEAHLPSTAGLVCSFLGVGLAGVGGWLGANSSLGLELEWILARTPMHQVRFPASLQPRPNRLRT